ncbi:MAG TPA: SGNH/GDSL hydrolase family protein [Bacteroidia bacterium]|jgi:lysophospholipase L1-like esterase|nr:SGNH/GDSL hydrolase family protein [Bacteroidia bacterium]
MLKKSILSLSILAFVCITIAMKEGKEATPIKYVALGDSYTIGEGAKTGEAFPDLLVKHLNENGIDITLSANPSVTGWTTQDLIVRELPVFDRTKPDFVTLLIGVNDWVQGVDSASFHKNLTYIIDHVQSLLPDKSKILLITIPDFGVTPTGKMYGEGRDISKGITAFNSIIKSEARKRNLPVADIFPETQKMKDDKDLIAHDGLHPSAKEYALWEKIIYPFAYKLLKG